MFTLSLLNYYLFIVIKYLGNGKLPMSRQTNNQFMVQPYDKVPQQERGLYRGVALSKFSDSELCGVSVANF